MTRSLAGRGPTPRLVAGALAVAGAVAVYLLATGLFPYHSANHDEAVYLQAAEMLLAGQLTLEPPVAEAFRPWFFVADGGQLYPKYAPVVPGLFAVGFLLGDPNLALAAIGGATVWLTYAVVAEAFDRPTGTVAAGLALASPLLLVQSAVFLPYVPTLCLNLTFAWAYLRADRTGDRRLAALAGVAIGLAFFARPYTAVLFALPFIAHALWTLRTLDGPVAERNLLSALLGLAGVGVALAYNAGLTGDPLTFPYQAFAPQDGLGFGTRRILGYERVYTLSLAIEAGVANLLSYALRWSVAAPLGVLAALAGLAYRLRDRSLDPRQLAIAGLGLTIPVGELYFWGTLNVLGDLSDPADGLVHLLGPYYHLGLVLPTAAFGAVAVLAAVRYLRPRLRALVPAKRRGALAALLLVTAGTGGVAATAMAIPIGDNAAVTDRYATAYEPVEDRDFENALVFLPTPYGDWLNHPFQVLRNEPDFDGPVVYALSTRELAVTEAYPERTLYRYVYRGIWAPTAGQRVTPHLQAVDRVAGRTVTLDLTAGVPRFTELVSVRLASAGATAATTVSNPGDELQLELTIANGTAELTGGGVDGVLGVPVDGRESLALGLVVDDGTAGTFTYEVGLPVDASGAGVRALSPHFGVCERPLGCDDGAAYVPGSHRDGVSLAANLSAGP